MAVLFTDDFNRANGGLGANWTAIDTSFTISSNVVVPTSTGSDALQIVNSVTWPNDQYAQIKVVALAVHANDIGPGLTLRCVDTNNYYRINVNSSNVQVAKVVSGGLTALANLGAGFVANDTLYVEVQSNTLKVFRNGVQFGGDVAGDAALASGSAGLFYSSTAAEAQVDDFVGGDFSSASTGLAWIRA